MPIPNEIYRLFRKIRDVFVKAIWPSGGIFKVKFLKFVLDGVASGSIDFSDFVNSNDMNNFYRDFRKLRDNYVDEHFKEITDKLGEGIDKDDLKKLPDWFVDFMGSKELFLNKLADIDSFIELPIDIRTELFDENKSLREEMLNRLIPIAFDELGVDEQRLVELASNKKEKREFYFDELFPKVINSAQSLDLEFSEPLVWRVADEILAEYR